MSSEKITLRVVASLGAGGTVWDTTVRGFGVRKQRRDPVYVLKYRFQGRQRFYTIGRHGAPWTPDTARSEALRLLGSIASNEAPRDPSAERSFIKAQPTFAEFTEQYLTQYAEAHKKPRTVAEDRRNLYLHALPQLGHLRVCDITRSDAARFHASRRKFPANANRCLATLSHMMTIAETWGLRPEDSNPCRKIKRYAEFARERSLSPTEMKRLGEALVEAQADPDTAEDWRAIACFKLLLFTGARLSEILTLRWEWINWEHGFARLPDSKTGRKNLLLPPPALSLLMSLPTKNARGYALPGMRIDSHFIGIQKPWQRLRKKAGLEDVRLHDLRHAFASVAVSAGDSLYTVGAILGHRQPMTTQRYAHLSADPIRAVADKTAIRIAALLAPPKSDSVDEPSEPQRTIA
jgi:integrase